MASKLGPPESRRVSDESVKAKTGKTWSSWYRSLDKVGAKEMNHKEIVAHIKEGYPDVSAWWMQMVTVGYEQERGLRDKHEKPGGYEISVSKTIEVPVSTLYKSWRDTRARNRWLADDDLVIRKATKDKSMRITWTDGQTSLSVNFYSKGRGKSQIVVQHAKLKNAAAAAKMKRFWSKLLPELKELLEI